MSCWEKKNRNDESIVGRTMVHWDGASTAISRTGLSLSLFFLQVASQMQRFVSAVNMAPVHV